jgi:hypothetical protein
MGACGYRTVPAYSQPTYGRCGHRAATEQLRRCWHPDPRRPGHPLLLCGRGHGPRSEGQHPERWSRLPSPHTADQGGSGASMASKIPQFHAPKGRSGPRTSRLDRRSAAGSARHGRRCLGLHGLQSAGLGDRMVWGIGCPGRRAGTGLRWRDRTGPGGGLRGCSCGPVGYWIGGAALELPFLICSVGAVVLRSGRCAGRPGTDAQVGGHR